MGPGSIVRIGSFTELYTDPKAFTELDEGLYEGDLVLVLSFQEDIAECLEDANMALVASARGCGWCWIVADGKNWHDTAVLEIR